MPKFSCVPPGPDTTGDWDEWPTQPVTVLRRIQEIRPAADIVADMMTEAHIVLAQSLEPAN